MVRFRLPLLVAMLVLGVTAVHASTPRLAAVAQAGGIVPVDTAAAQAGAAVQQNAAIAARSEAAIAAGAPTRMLVTFRVPEQHVAAQAGAVSQSAMSGGTAMSAADILNAARRQVNAAVKARVLGPAAATASNSRVVDEAAPTSTAAQQPAQAQGGVRVLSDYPLMPVTLVSISSSAELARLRANPEVASVVADGVVRPMTMNGLDMIGQPAVLTTGFAGVGTVVTFDTGLDYTRDVFGPCTAPGVPAATCKVLYTQDFASSDNALDVGDFHGTNVAGIIVGVAPGVRLIGLDIFAADGTGSWSTLIAAMDWAVANKGRYNITGANLSLGGGQFTGACDDQPLAVSINTAFSSGIVSAVAAGNEGYTDSLSAPACASSAVSVGAVFPEDVTGEVAWQMGCSQTNPKADQVVCFSNSNSQLTVLAPGYSIAAAGITLSGTSQATPFVAGSLAVLRQRYPSYTPAQLVAQLTSTGVQITDPRNNLAKPRLNLQAAVGAITPTCTVTVSPADVTAAAGGGTYSLQVTASSASCSWTVSVAGATWLAPTPASGSGTAAVVLQASTNSGAARSAIVTVTATDGSATATVQQAAAPPPPSDVTPPVQSRVTGIPTRYSVSLSWTPATDAGGSGVTSYKVVYNMGTVSPRARCTSGAAVARQASFTSSAAASTYHLRVTGLQRGSKYTFRVCAIDAAGNVARGAVWRGATRS